MRSVQFTNNHCKNIWIFLKEIITHPLEGTTFFYPLDKENTMNAIDMVTENLFTREIEHIKMMVGQDWIWDDMKFGVPFFLSDLERMSIVKNYLQERLDDIKTNDPLER